MSFFYFACFLFFVVVFFSRFFFFFFFFQAEDGIRDTSVTGVQTCALPISPERLQPVEHRAARIRPRPRRPRRVPLHARRPTQHVPRPPLDDAPVCGLRHGGGVERALQVRSEERRVGKECRARWWQYAERKK